MTDALTQVKEVKGHDCKKEHPKMSHIAWLAQEKDAKNQDKDPVGPQHEEVINEVSPPGFKGTVKAMKKHKEIDNPFALAWHMKNKGDKAHYKDKDGKPEKKEKYKEEAVDPAATMKKARKQRAIAGIKTRVQRAKDAAARQIAAIQARESAEDAYDVKAKKGAVAAPGSGTIAKAKKAKASDVNKSLEQQMKDAMKEHLVKEGQMMQLKHKESKQKMRVALDRYRKQAHVYRQRGWVPDSAQPHMRGGSDIQHQYVPDGEVIEGIEFKVKLRGLPAFYMPGKSAAEVKMQLRKQLKKPQDDIESIDRVTTSKKRKAFRQAAMGKDDE
tara:strand:+ start:215 stop:1198 length:984 start_codon:yes stop_codon:yes gene_type:complete